MTETSVVYDQADRSQGTFNRRIVLMGATVGLGMTGLAAQLARLQLIEADRYAKLSDDNHFNYQLSAPPRGQILDRTGVPIATNRPNLRVLITKSKATKADEVIAQVSRLVQLDENDVTRIRKRLRDGSLNDLIPIVEELSWEEFSRINLHIPELPEMSADIAESRIYPYPGIFSHVLGYVAKVSTDDIEAAGDKVDPILRYPGFRIGKQGVEKAFEAELRGVPGARKLEVDARGRVIREDTKGMVPVQAGKTIKLTLDLDIQSRALEVFKEDSGAAVMMDCHTGEILCMASAPSFDTNKFVRGMSGKDYRALSGYERLPLLDKALSGTYPPGSTFKPITALAILQAGIEPEEKILCTGGWNFSGRRWGCWNKRGHGWQNMHEAIKNSCDVYFYQMAIRAGPDRIEETCRHFGIGEVFDIGIKGQKKGIRPSRQWKLENRKEMSRWLEGDSANVGIGQGFISTNALQLCVMTARLANGNRAITPRLVSSIGDVPYRANKAPEPLPFPREHLDYVRAAMAAVANDRSGTAYKASQLGLGGIKMSGKTGTAQVRNYKIGESRSNKGIAWRLRDHGLFVAFAPHDNPKFALSVIVQHGTGGAAVAAPKAREIMRVALIKDQEMQSRLIQPEAVPLAIDASGDAEGAAPEGVVTAPQAGIAPLPILPSGVVE